MLTLKMPCNRIWLVKRVNSIKEMVYTSHELSTKSFHVNYFLNVYNILSMYLNKILLKSKRVLNLSRSVF